MNAILHLCPPHCYVWEQTMALQRGCHEGPLDSLCKMQRRTCLWITGTFKISPIRGAETLVDMPPIHLHVCFVFLFFGSTFYIVTISST
jgi:hypothetical protein